MHISSFLHVYVVTDVVIFCGKH